MKSVASRQEYERASQIRDRIQEFKKYISSLSAEGDQEFTLNK